MRRVKVGLVGLGEVAQITHLPILRQLADRYEIAALCDLSPNLIAVVGAEYGVERLYTDAAELAAQDDLDAVFVLNSDEYHAEAALAAMRRGKHVLIEKPMCLTQSEADEIIRTRDEFGVKAMVGYMRRFAPAFVEAARQVGELEKINFVQVRDIIGHNGQFISQSSHVHRFSDLPAWAIDDRANRAKRLVTEAIGDAPEHLQRVYRLMCGLSSHDLSAMRELIGMPKRVIAASTWNEGGFLTAIFDFGDFHGVFETGVDQVRRFDAHIEVFSKNKIVKVQYNTPYIRHIPTMLQVQETIGEALHESDIRPTFKDAYTIELEHFYDVVVHGAEPKTPPEDFKQDLQLFSMIIDALR